MSFFTAINKHDYDDYKQMKRISQFQASGPEKRLRSDLDYIGQLIKLPPQKREIADVHKALIADAYRQAWKANFNMRDVALEQAGESVSSDASNEDLPYHLGPNVHSGNDSRQRGGGKFSRYSQPRPKIHGMTLNADEEQLLGKIMGSVGRQDIKNIAALELQIHPIFKWENWQTPFLFEEALPHIRNAWITMFPAFILATKLLTTTAAESFWHRLMCGTLATRGGKTFLVPSPLEDDLPFVRAQFARLLDFLQQRVNFYFDFSSDCHGWTLNCFWDALSHLDPVLCNDLIRNYPGYDSDNHVGARLDAHLGMHPKYLLRLLSAPFEDDDHGNPNVRLHLQVAITLTHELCHALWSLRNLHHEEVRPRESDFETEVGTSFENELWGGVILCSSFIKSSSARMNRIYARAWEANHQPLAVETLVPDTLLAKLFRDETWEDWPAWLDALPLPVGRQREFVAQRYISQGRFQGKVKGVKYGDGVVVTPGCEYLNEVEEGPGEEDIEDWYRRIKVGDERAAVASGEFRMEKSDWEGDGRYRDQLQKVEDGDAWTSEDEEALLADFFASDSSDEDDENDEDYEDEDDEEGDGSDISGMSSDWNTTDSTISNDAARNGVVKEDPGSDGPDDGPAGDGPGSDSTLNNSPASNGPISGGHVSDSPAGNSPASNAPGEDEPSKGEDAPGEAAASEDGSSKAAPTVLGQKSCTSLSNHPTNPQHPHNVTNFAAS